MTSLRKLWKNHYVTRKSKTLRSKGADDYTRAFPLWNITKPKSTIWKGQNARINPPIPTKTITHWDIAGGVSLPLMTNQCCIDIHEEEDESLRHVWEQIWRIPYRYS